MNVHVKTYDHTSKIDMVHLQDEIRLLKGRGNTTKADFYSCVIAAGMMRTHFWVHLSVGMVCRFKRVSAQVAWSMVLREMGKRDPKVLDGFIDGLATHVAHGKDRVDPRSAGGLNGPELEKLLKLMSAFGWTKP